MRHIGAFLLIALVLATTVHAQTGSCGNGTSCQPGYCCSLSGFCGITDLHCGAGCQPTYGVCGIVSGASVIVTAGSIPVSAPASATGSVAASVASGVQSSARAPSGSAPASVTPSSSARASAATTGSSSTSASPSTSSSSGATGLQHPHGSKLAVAALLLVAVFGMGL